MKFIAGLIVCILPFLTTAQGLIAGIHGGIMYNTAPKPATTTAVKPYGSLRLYKPVNDIELGFCLDIGSLDANTSVQYVDSTNKKLQFITYTEKYARYFIMPNISVNSRTPLKFGSWYFGANIGYMFGRTTFMEAPTPYTVVKQNQGTYGASIGLHTGLCINAGKKLGFNIEAAGRYTSIGKHRPKLFYFPLSAGLQYAF